MLPDVSELTDFSPEKKQPLPKAPPRKQWKKETSHNFSSIFFQNKFHFICSDAKPFPIVAHFGLCFLQDKCSLVEG
jgi:hypothetical protein